MSFSVLCVTNPITERRKDMHLWVYWYCKLQNNNIFRNIMDMKPLLPAILLPSLTMLLLRQASETMKQKLAPDRHMHQLSPFQT